MKKENIIFFIALVFVSGWSVKIGIEKLIDSYIGPKMAKGVEIGLHEVVREFNAIEIPDEGIEIDTEQKLPSILGRENSESSTSGKEKGSVVSDSFKGFF